jgi:orotidine-5'-phosphate decarboxylase
VIVAAPVPIVALDVPTAERAIELVERLPRADFFKVGLQLYTAAGPSIVRELKERGASVFLDLKLHDIPNTVAGAVGSAAALGVDLLTLHASGGTAMLSAAVQAAAGAPHRPRLFGVTILTSLSGAELARAWGRDVADPAAEAARLASVAERIGLDGVVTSVHEVAAIRGRTRTGFALLVPGIRLAGDDPGDQARVATPEQAARLAIDYVVLGRTVTAAADPALAYDRVLDALAPPGDRLD